MAHTFDPNLTQLMGQLRQYEDEGMTADAVNEAMLLHVRELENICWQQSARLRGEAQRQIHRAARCVMLREQADALEAEASTWKLMR